MSLSLDAFNQLKQVLDLQQVTLVAVSKTKPIEDIMALYEAGQRDFGENYVQELVDKQQRLPADIRWHFIGHLQSNKVKYIAPFVHLVHGVDSLKLLQTISKQGLAQNRVIDCLLQVHIAQEETKFGLNRDEIFDILADQSVRSGLGGVRICGMMGMASFTDDQDKLRKEFRQLKSLFDEVRVKYFSNDPSFDTLSMGMSSDYALAIEAGSNMVRIGSLLFGARQ